MEFIDYYEIMGVRPEATADEIKRAYRKLARKYHPDVSDEADAAERFKRVGEAYAVLKDPERRREYDELRLFRERGGGDAAGGFRPPPGWRGAPGGSAGGGWREADAADFSDFFREIFGAAAAGGGGVRGGADDGGLRLKGEDIHATLSIPLQAAHDGATLPLSLRAPRRRDGGAVDLDERTLQVKIPRGVTSGQRIRLRGQGGPGWNGGEAGDLYIELAIEDDPRFALEGRDVTHVLAVAPWEAALGASVPVPTLGGEVRLTIPPGSSGGRRLRLRGRGLAGDPPGDQFVVLRVELPQPENAEQRALYERMSELWAGYDPRGDGGRR